MTIEVSIVHPSKMYPPIALTEFDIRDWIFSEVSPEHLWKARSSIIDREVGISTEVNPVQEMNAWSPSSVTEFGILIEVSPAQSAKAACPI
jgi:hypothetical protein